VYFCTVIVVYRDCKDKAYLVLTIRAYDLRLRQINQKNGIYQMFETARRQTDGFKVYNE